ncbi:GNAT family N-acetyltransferase [Streptomyces sp. NPDC056987]|uniref:GNAT family N-acetyltransferase n=1 Tax=Streptomyces sp. NPDC056987 TaxID=3345988 RepID=UPI00364285D9
MRSLEIVPFESGFAERAALLLAEAHADGGAGRPAGVLDLADPGVARRLVGEWQGSGPGVAAVRDGRLTGFMAATVSRLPGEQWARIRLPQYACERHERHERRATWRSLYAALSGRLAGIGAYDHAVEVPAYDRETVSCFFELGFGIDQVRGFRPVTGPETPAEPPRGTRLRAARAGDLARMFELAVELQRFHTAAPVLRPALSDLRPIREAMSAALTDDAQLLLVAEEDGRLTGLVQAAADARRTGAATIGLAVVAAPSRSTGVGTALVTAVGEWAAGRGFDAYGAEWSSANQVSDAFWRGRGMVPARFKLRRLIDSRVAWAEERLSYGHFG